MLLALYIALGVVAGGAGGFFVRSRFAKRSDAEVEAKQEQMLLEAKQQAVELKERAQQELSDRKKELDKLEGVVREREGKIDDRLGKIEEELKEIDQRRQSLADREKRIEQADAEHQKQLESIAKLNQDEAKDLLLKQVEQEFQGDLVAKAKEQQGLVQEEFEAWGRKILATAMGRFVGETTSEHSIQPVSIPSEDVKGRIIGKEGRNIQAFEKLTGVDVIIDESPDTVTISSFDSVRRHMARLTLEQLIADGRIHPGKIEEIWEKVRKQVAKEIREAGEQAARDAGVVGLHPDLIKIMGQLKFRTSFGQNVLKHCTEMAPLAAMIAEEMGADVTVARKAAFLHDIGKAVDHEIPGAHHHIGMDIARKYGLSEVVINAIGAHHDDIEAKTVEALIVRMADAISGGRPGARRDTYENYVKRVTELENIAKGFTGVDKAFAIHAGREIRVIVTPTEISDLDAMRLAKDIAAKVEQDMQYPGMIKVNVIRETRHQEYAK